MKFPSGWIFSGFIAQDFTFFSSRKFGCSDEGEEGLLFKYLTQVLVGY